MDAWSFAVRPRHGDGDDPPARDMNPWEALQRRRFNLRPGGAVLGLILAWFLAIPVTLAAIEPAFPAPTDLWWNMSHYGGATFYSTAKLKRIHLWPMYRNGSAFLGPIPFYAYTEYDPAAANHNDALDLYIRRSGGFEGYACYCGP